MMISVIDRAENIVGKEENAGVTSIFFFSYNDFKRRLPWVRQKSGLCGSRIQKQNNGDCTARPDCTYAQADIALHSPENKSKPANGRVKKRT